MLTIYRIPTGSMIPTLKVGDVLVANHFYYGLKFPFTYDLEGFRLPSIKEPERGDVLIFRGPKEVDFYNRSLISFTEESQKMLETINEEAFLVKRIISINNGKKNYIYLQNPFNLGYSEISLSSEFYKKYKAVFHEKTKSPYVRFRVRPTQRDRVLLLEEISGWKRRSKNVKEIQKVCLLSPGKDGGMNSEVYDLFVPQTLRKKIKNFLENNGSLVEIYDETLLENNFVIRNIEREKRYVTYDQVHYRGFLASVLSTPLSGISMIGTVLINAPLFLPYKAVLNHLDFLWSNAVETKKQRAEKNLSFSDKAFKRIKWYPNSLSDSRKDYVKRVIGMPGDEIKIVNRQIFVNGKPAFGDKKPFITDPENASFMLSQEMITKNETIFKEYLTRYSKLYSVVKTDESPFDPKLWPFDPNNKKLFYTGFYYKDYFGPIVIPKKHYFVLGDNRDESFDSRYWGLVPASAIRGVPMLKLFPLKRFGVVK